MPQLLYLLETCFSASIWPFLNHLSWLRRNSLAIFPTAPRCLTSHVFLTQSTRLAVLQTGRVWQTDCVMIRVRRLLLEERVQIRIGIQSTALSTVQKVRPAFDPFLHWLFVYVWYCWRQSIWDTDEDKGADAFNFTNSGVAVRRCTDEWAAGLMCCDGNDSFDNMTENASCCPKGTEDKAMNLFSIGSKPRNSESISLSFTSPSANIPLSTATLSTISMLVPDSVVESLSLRSALSFSSASSSGPTSSFSHTPSSTATPNQSAINGQTIAIAVSTSVGSVALIIAIFLLHQRRGKRREHRLNQNLIENQNLHMVHRPEAIYEISGLQQHEVPENLRAITQELPERA